MQPDEDSGEVQSVFITAKDRAIMDAADRARGIVGA
jgi:hypothetical protein